MEKTNNKTTLKGLYSDIRELLFKMIPEKWDRIYLYASVIESNNCDETGEMFFYYYPKSIIKKNPVNVYEVPTKFNINEAAYMKIANELYNLIKKLKYECIKIDNTNWTNISISIENVEFLVEYNFDNLENSEYTSEERRDIWKCKYLDFPIEKLSKNSRKMVKRYQQEEEWGQHGVTVYSETFYQKHIHNDVTYNVEHENYINEEEEPKEEKKKVINQLLKKQ